MKKLGSQAFVTRQQDWYARWDIGYDGTLLARLVDKVVCFPSQDGCNNARNLTKCTQVGQLDLITYLINVLVLRQSCHKLMTES